MWMVFGLGALVQVASAAASPVILQSADTYSRGDVAPDSTLTWFALLDEALVDQSTSQGVELAVRAPQQLTPGTVLVSDRPWESARLAPYASVVSNGTHILMYYYIMNVGVARTNGTANHTVEQSFTCLATSSDGGLSFEKPSLGVVKINGSDTNCVWPNTATSYSQMHETGTVFVDDRAGVPASQKFKMIARWGSPTKPPGTYTFASRDGIDWTPLRPHRPAYDTSDTQEVAFYDGNLHKYLAFRRSHAAKEGHPECQSCVGEVCGKGEAAARTVTRCVSDDFIVWPGCEDVPFLSPQPLNENCSMALGFDAFDDPCVDVYNSQAIQFSGTETHYLMFASAYWHFPAPPAWELGGDGMWDVRLAHSRTGFDFKYINDDRSPWIPRGRMAAPRPNAKTFWPSND